MRCFASKVWQMISLEIKNLVSIKFLKKKSESGSQVVVTVSSVSRTYTILLGRSRTAATYKMELFVIIVNGWNPLTIITKSLILNVTGSPRSASALIRQPNLTS